MNMQGRFPCVCPVLCWGGGCDSERSSYIMRTCLCLYNKGSGGIQACSHIYAYREGGGGGGGGGGEYWIYARTVQKVCYTIVHIYAYI